MRATYIGILEKGTTSRMRAECLKEITPGVKWQWIDTSVPFQSCHRIWRSLAFRAKFGPALNAINRCVLGHMQGTSRSDLVWVDKGVFLRISTIKSVRRLSKCLIHYTPDTAFHDNRSRHFNASLPYFDLIVTTKSFEESHYLRYIDKSKLHITTQGFDPRLHFPRQRATARERSAVFIGLAEPDREQCISALLQAGIKVRLGGKGWSNFLRLNSHFFNLEFLGREVFGETYAHAYSGSWIGLGLLTKRFTELHTTRTFEIPACGAILAPERTSDTASAFADHEVLFYENYNMLATRIKSLFITADDQDLERISIAGRSRVMQDHRDYRGILSEILMNAQISSLCRIIPING